VRKENPAFACAVARYYSVEHGQRKAAVKGQLALWRAAEKIADRHPSALRYSLSIIARVRRAVREGDNGYLARFARAALSAKPDDEKHLSFVEYIFDAYYFLRKRDGEGSPLPTKAEVKNTAAIIAAFDVEGLTAKLHDYVWHERGLTEKEFQRVEGVRKYLVEDKDPETNKPRDHNWPERLAAAGLSDLPQKRDPK
jgi:hypothetical protein